MHYWVFKEIVCLMFILLFNIILFLNYFFIVFDIVVLIRLILLIFSLSSLADLDFNLHPVSNDNLSNMVCY